MRWAGEVLNYKEYIEFVSSIMHPQAPLRCMSVIDAQPQPRFKAASGAGWLDGNHPVAQCLATDTRELTLGRCEGSRGWI